MIVDTSAILAILFGEPEAEVFAAAVLSSESKMSAATYVEVMSVAARYHDPAVTGRLKRLISRLGITVVPVSVDQAERAADAYAQYGRGSGHAAGLNFGDVFSYALAVAEDEPLLFKGSDFSRTDVQPT